MMKIASLCLFFLYVVLLLPVSNPVLLQAESPLHDVGIILPLSGDLAVIGNKFRKGIEFSALPYKHIIRLKFQDGGIHAKTAVSAFRQILSTSKAKSIIGPWGLDQTLSVAALRRPDELVILAVTACHKRYQSYPNVFCVYPSYEVQLKSTLDVFDGAASLKGKSLGLFIQESESREYVRKAMYSFAENNGMTISVEKTITANSTDFRSVLLKARGVDIFFVNTYVPNEALLILKQLRELGIEPEMRWWFSEEDSELIKKNSRLLEGVYVMGSFDKIDQRFVEEFFRIEGVKPDLYHAIAADTAATLFRTLSSLPNSSVPHLRDALEKAGPRKPACKGFQFSSERTVTLSLVPKRIINGELKVTKID